MEIAWTDIGLDGVGNEEKVDEIEDLGHELVD